MTDPLLDDLLSVADAAASAAAAVLRTEYGRRRSDVSTKSSATDMVSGVDRAAEQAVVAVLAERRPDDGILAEEGSDRAGTSGVRWVVDPLDGTTNYLFGVPAFAVSVAAEIEGVPSVGVVVDPSRNETWRAVRGRGATRDGHRVQLPATPPPLAAALVATGFSYLPERRAHQADVLRHVLPRVRDIRRFGAAALDLCWVAGGRVNAFYELGLQPWDLAAGVVIVAEAGGEVAELSDGTVLVTAPGLQGPLRALLEEAAGSAEEGARHVV